MYNLEIDLFNYNFPKKIITKPIRLIELFGGIGSQAKALQKIGANFENYKLVEFDKYCINAYNNIHKTNFFTSDITKINGKDLEIKEVDKYEYIMTYSFPCQDLSLAGKMQGMKEDSNTRSSLLWEVKRLLKEVENLPQVLLMENVPQVHSKENMKDFQKWINFLESLGYSNFWKDLNALNFGIPQKRKRTFMISILGNYIYEFPKKKKLKLKLKDMLEDEVDEKYYLSQRMIDGMTKTNFESYKLENKLLDENGVANCIIARFEGAPQCIQIKEATKKGYAEAEEGDGVYINRPHQKRGVVQKGMIQTLKTNPDVGVVVRDKNLKEQLCDRLIESGVVKENDVINHSYTNGLNGKNPNSRIKLEDYIETKDNISPCLTTRPDTLGVVIKDKNLWTDTQKRMITDDGNVKRYLDSEIVDEFYEGQVADISFPNGYNKGQRVHNECPAINGTTTQSSFIVKVEIPQIVRVRKYSVDTEKLVNTLREHKELCGFLNKEIAKELDLPITKVEHWFRKDNSFAIPDAEIWYELKRLLKIETDEFDKSIMTFEEREGTYEKSNRCYHEDGISPTLTSASADEKVITNLRIRKLTPKECWRLMGFDDEDIDCCIENGISNAQLYKMAGNSIVVNVLMEIFKQLF